MKKKPGKKWSSSEIQGSSRLQISIIVISIEAILLIDLIVF